jgi:predicted RNase H-like HicB family nuclease
MKEYEVVIQKDSETKQIFASVPILPGCYTYGDSIEEVLLNIKEAIELHLDNLKDSNKKSKLNEVVGMVKVSV